MFLKKPSDEDRSLSFAEIFPQELDLIGQARAKREVPPRKPPIEQDLIGLAFSGGGIRSATFNLGVIQALARAELLRYIDYLSTVSGGGYIGSWLSSWCYYMSQKNSGPNHISQVEQELNRKPAHAGDISEPHEVHFLRKYSNYLTPRLGSLSGDTLAFAATYLRNLLLNQIILVSALLALLLIPRSLGLVFLRFHDLTSAWVCITLSVLFLIGVVWGIARNADGTQPDSARRVVIYIALPQFFFCILVTYGMWQFVHTKILQKSVRDWLLPETWQKSLVFVAGCAFVYVVLWIIGALIGDKLRSVTQPERTSSWYLRWAPAIWSPPAGFLTGGFVLLVSRMLSSARFIDGETGIWHVLTFGVPLVVILVLVVGAVHLGLIGRAFQDGLREWWARLGGAALSLTIQWFLICLLTLFFPMWIDGLWQFLQNPAGSWLGRTLSGIGVAGTVTGWIGTTLSGLFAAKGKDTGPRAPTATKLDLLAKIAPSVFVVGLIALLSLALKCLVPLVAGGGTPIWWKVLLFVASLIVVSLFMGYRVDVNEFSLHNAYRNRIVRCYLGATNRNRKPQPFTGFDENDNIFLDLLKHVGAPFHIVNATLNVVKGKELALQSRKARSFTFTPLYSGFDFTQEQSVSEMPGAIKTEANAQKTCDPKVMKPGSYRLTENSSYRSRYSGARLGTAMAISGAAASPNMGHYTSGAVAFLLTIFSVRLGWWMGNPRKKKSWESGHPRASWRALMNELTGNTNEEQNEVYLSDGGHFENLAVYELVRRRCRLIIACDSGADPDCACNDLASAIEKCRVDFATDINISLDEIRPSVALFPGDAKSRISQTPYTIGTIHYPDNTRGTLIYIKPSLNAHLPQDVLAYARLAQAFPHQSTVDQFFDESQFESYRALGFACATSAIDDIKKTIQA